MDTRTLAFALASLLAVGAAHAAKVYKSVLPDGTVVYSDTRPSEEAREVELPPIQLYSPPPLPRPAVDAPKEPEAFTGYDTFEVASPSQDETVRDSGGTVSVALTLSPSLRPGHSVEIFLDGKSIGSGQGTSASITDVDRGSHSVNAVVRDADGKEIARTSSVTFHLKKASRLHPPRGTGS